MKKITIWLLVAVLLVGLVAGAVLLYKGSDGSNDGGSSREAEQTDPDYTANGVPMAPNFTVIDASGNEVELSDFRGKPVVLNFWATWCFYCLLEMPDFQEAYEKYPEVQFLMVNATDGVEETVEQASSYISGAGFDFDVFYDTKRQAVNAYHAYSYPVTFFIDKEGGLVAHGNGMLNLAELEYGIAMITE